jgi:hypothetical protein
LKLNKVKNEKVLAFKEMPKNFQKEDFKKYLTLLIPQTLLLRMEKLLNLKIYICRKELRKIEIIVLWWRKSSL